MTYPQIISVKLIQIMRLVKNQLLLSQVGGLSSCRYKETCGDYLIRQVKQTGVVIGLWLGFKRIVSCQGFI